MRRNLILLNLLLVALIGLVSWRLFASYDETLRRQKSFLSAPAPAAPPPVVMLPPPPGQVSAANYYEIASKLPFSKDRNPTVVLEVVAPKPMPALPRYYGLLNLGQDPRVILASASGQPQKSYIEGQSIGDFKLVTIADSGLVFEWDGKQVPARYEEMKDTAPAAGAQQATPAASSSGPATGPAAAARPAGAVTALSTPVSGDVSKPGVSLGESLKSCQAGDKSAAGSVVDGYRKVISRTPFGESCRWEKIN